MAVFRIDMALGTLDARIAADNLARYIMALSSIARSQQDLHTLIVTGRNPEDGAS